MNSARELSQFDAEIWFAEKLRCRGLIFAGNSTTEIRGERFRRFITEGNLADRHLGTLGGRAYTVGQYWERLYGEHREA